MVDQSVNAAVSSRSSHLMDRQPPDGVVQHRSYCRFCGAQCGILVTTEGGRVLRVLGDPDHPVSAGYSCNKGRALPHFHHDPRRLDAPAVGRLGDRRSIAWEDLLTELASTLSEIIDDTGPDAVGIFLGTGGGFDSAGTAILGRLTKAIGTRSFYTPLTVDGPSKPYVALMVAGHPGLQAAIDYERTTMTLFVGVNP